MPFKAREVEITMREMGWESHCPRNTGPRRWRCQEIGSDQETVLIFLAQAMTSKDRSCGLGNQYVVYC